MQNKSPCIVPKLAKPSHSLIRHCYQQKDGQWHKGSDRTLHNLVENHEEYLQSNSSRKNVKRFFNVEHAPLIVHEAMDKPVVLTVPPPALHVLKLGPVNKVINPL